MSGNQRLERSGDGETVAEHVTSWYSLCIVDFRSSAPYCGLFGYFKSIKSIRQLGMCFLQPL